MKTFLHSFTCISVIPAVSVRHTFPHCQGRPEGIKSGFKPDTGYHPCPSNRPTPGQTSQIISILYTSVQPMAATALPLSRQTKNSGGKMGQLSHSQGVWFSNKISVRPPSSAHKNQLQAGRVLDEQAVVRRWE